MSFSFRAQESTSEPGEIVAVASDRATSILRTIIGGRDKPRSRKKTWGIFYTPDTLIHHLTKWAVTANTDSILEPSFGGCGFLDACATRLKLLGAKAPWEQMAGCDIDQRAFANLPSRFRLPLSSHRFLLKNFLETKPADYPLATYSVVIGNPPYVSRHNMRQYQLETARAILVKNGISIRPNASLWAYFVIHSLAFLEEGGKMAWVLPRSLTQADYGKKIIQSLRSRFEKIDILCVGTREFVSVGAEEFVDILLCDGHRVKEAACGELRLHHLAKTPPPDAPLIPVNEIHVATRSPREQSLTQIENTSIQELKQQLKVVPLGDFADANIGIVTGATDFFVRSKPELPDYDLFEDRCRFLVTRFGFCRGLHLTKSDADMLVADGERVLLVEAKNPLNAAYWKRFPTDRIGKIKTFEKRQDWKDPDDGKHPDAFFPPLIQQYPRLVINTVRANCTNTVHRVYFRENVNVLRRWACVVAMMTTPVQLSCEMVGRQCGSGGLKIEPSDFGKIEIPSFTIVHLQTVSRAAEELDTAMRRGAIEQAVKLADAWLYDGLATRPDTSIQLHVANALQQLHAMRIRP